MFPAHDLEVDEFAARPEEERLTAAQKNERINKQLAVSYLTTLHCSQYTDNMYRVAQNQPDFSIFQLNL